MNRKLIVAIAVLVAAIVIGTVVFAESGEIGKAIGAEFGFSEKITATSYVPGIISSDVISQVSLNSTLSFQKLAENPTVIDAPNMTSAGWGVWFVNDQSIIVTGGTNNISGESSPAVVPFVQIQNGIGHSVTLSLMANLTDGRIASYALSNTTTVDAGFIVAVSNGTNYTLINQSSSNNTVVGRGTVITGNLSVVLGANEYLSLYLGAMPHSFSRHMINYDGVATSGIVSITV